MENEALRQILKVVLTACAVPLPLLLQRVETGRVKFLRFVLYPLLIMLAGVSALSYFDFGHFRYGRYINPHDVFHYYIGSKYSREIDYADLYRCALLADMEGKKVYKEKNVRDLSTHGYENVSHALQEAAKVKAHFSPERWAEFKHDIAYFISIMPASKWNAVLLDKGYNATPIWNGVARFLTNRVSTDNWAALNALLLIDPLLMILGFAAVWWAFGWRAALIAAIFFNTNFMGSFVHIKGALLRLDWVIFLVIATCLLKKERYKTAGALMAYSAMARVFPAVFVFGLGVKTAFRAFEYARETAKARKLVPLTAQDRRYVAFFLAFAIASGVFASIATVEDGGTHRWHSFSQKISVHNSDISTTRVGFKYIFLSPFNSFQEKGIAFQNHHVLWRILTLALLLLAAVPARRIKDYETIPYGFVPAFFLTAPTFYYYVMLIVPFLFFASRLDSLTRSLGAAGMFLISFVSYWQNQTIPFGFDLCLRISWMFQILVLYIMAAAYFTKRPVVELAAAEPQPIPIPPPAEDKHKHRSKKRKGTAAHKAVAAPQPPPSKVAPPQLKRILPWAATAAGVILTAFLAGWALRHTSTPRPQTASRTADCVELVFVGDVMLSRNVAQSVKQHNIDYTFPFQNTLKYTNAADLAFCNLECPVSERGESLSKRYVFRAEPRAITGLKAAGFNVATLANNHVLDFGPDGLQDTIKVLDDNKITHLGITTNDAPQTPAVFTVKGTRIGCLAYADPKAEYAYAKEYYQYPTRPAKAEKETIRADIARLKPQADIIVVCIHWGTEYETLPNAEQQDLGRFIIDSGANIVAGHHPHVLQDPEWHNGGVIIYSLGNFVFDQHSRPATRLSRIFRIGVNKGGIALAEYLPLEITNQDWQPTPTASAFVAFPNPASSK